MQNNHFLQHVVIVGQAAAAQGGICAGHVGDRIAMFHDSRAQKTIKNGLELAFFGHFACFFNKNCCFFDEFCGKNRNLQKFGFSENPKFSILPKIKIPY